MATRIHVIGVSRLLGQMTTPISEMLPSDVAAIRSVSMQADSSATDTPFTPIARVCLNADGGKIRFWDSDASSPQQHDGYGTAEQEVHQPIDNALPITGYVHWFGSNVWATVIITLTCEIKPIAANE